VQGSDAACGRFTRGSNGQVNALDRSLVNAGYRETAGYDINVRYRLPETAFGKFAVNWNTTYTDYLEQRNDSAATTPVEQRTGWAATSACAPPSTWIGSTATSASAGPRATTPA
jgi:iron complex outermembrane receptor protein